MRRIILVAFLGIFQYLVYAQTPADKEQILSLCMEMGGLERYYTSVPGQPADKLFVLNVGVDFGTEPNVSALGKSLVFYDKVAMQAMGINSFFVFYVFDVQSGSARADFTYYKDAQALEGIRYYLELTLENNGWQILTEKSKEL